LAAEPQVIALMSCHLDPEQRATLQLTLRLDGRSAMVDLFDLE